MGIKFGREYDEIIDEFTKALLEIEGCHDFLEMTEAEWAELEPEERTACVKTLADDVFYGLGTEPEVYIGDCLLTHDAQRHVIRLACGEAFTREIRLV